MDFATDYLPVSFDLTGSFKTYFMLLTRRKTIESMEQVELKVHAYYKGYSSYYFINSEGVLIYLSASFIAYYNPGERYYEDNIDKALEGTEITKEEFMSHWQKISEKLLAIVDDVPA